MIFNMKMLLPKLKQHEEMRFKELSVILCGNYHYALKKLSPTVVEAIHDILEKEAT